MPLHLGLSCLCKQGNAAEYAGPGHCPEHVAVGGVCKKTTLKWVQRVHTASVAAHSGSTMPRDAPATIFTMRNLVCKAMIAGLLFGLAQQIAHLLSLLLCSQMCSQLRKKKVLSVAPSSRISRLRTALYLLFA